MMIEAIIIGTSLITILIGGQMSGTSLSLAFGYGYSMEMGFIIKESQGTDQWTIRTGTRIMTSVTFGGQLLFILEMVCYAKIYLELYKNDQRIGKNLTPDDILYRKKRNVITLSGQFMTFLIEILTSILMMVTLMFYKNYMVDASLVAICHIVSNSFLSMSYVLTSPELKRHYFKFM